MEQVNINTISLSVGESLQLLSLPPELIAVILSHLPTSSLLRILNTSQLLRQICRTSEEAWKVSLVRDLTTAGHLYYPHQKRQLTQAESDSFEHLASIGRSPFIPTRVWMYLLQLMTRSFILYSELPYLKQKEWKEVCVKRFSVTCLKRRENVVEEGVGHQGEIKKQMSWRAFFLKELARFEHREESGCSISDHSVSLTLGMTFGV